MQPFCTFYERNPDSADRYRVFSLRHDEIECRGPATLYSPDTRLHKICCKKTGVRIVRRRCIDRFFSKQFRNVRSDHRNGECRTDHLLPVSRSHSRFRYRDDIDGSTGCLEIYRPFSDIHHCRRGPLVYGKGEMENRR